MKRDDIDIAHLQSKLQEELEELTEQLSEIAVQDETGDWLPKVEKDNAMVADRTEIADKSERYSDNAALLHNLEIRYANIVRALTKIEEGTYGFCEIGKMPIEADRLAANPAARTSKAHMDEEASLPM